MTTYLNQNRRRFKAEFLPDVVITEYIEWMFSENSVILRYRTIEGEYDCPVSNHTFDEWLSEIQSRDNKKQ